MIKKSKSGKTMLYHLLFSLFCGARIIYANYYPERIITSPRPKRNNVIQPHFTQQKLIKTSRIRGGGSDSKSAWSAGSRRYYPSGSGYPSNKSTSSSGYSKDGLRYVSSRETEEQATKEVFAEAFLRREDRNRFIGENCCKLLLKFILVSYSSLSHPPSFLPKSSCLCNFNRSASFHCWNNSRISLESRDNTLDVVISCWKKRLV